MGVRQGRGLKKKRYLSLELRLRLYGEVLQLREEGLSYSDVIERIHRLYGVQLRKSHISYWVRGVHAPLGRVNKFDEKPSPQLAYIIGVMLSDGNLNSHSDHNYDMLLRVKDFEYAYEFSRCLAKVLQRRNRYAIRWRRRANLWGVAGNSVLLYKFLRQPLEKLKPFIEHSKDCAAAFLKAFFDGEGSIRGRQLTVYNVDRQLLIYIVELLKTYFGIETTGPHIANKRRTVIYCPRTKRAYKLNKHCYTLYVRTRSLIAFYQHVGFTIERKRRRLAQAVKQ